MTRAHFTFALPWHVAPAQVALDGGPFRAKGLRELLPNRHHILRTREGVTDYLESTGSTLANRPRTASSGLHGGGTISHLAGRKLAELRAFKCLHQLHLRTFGAALEFSARTAQKPPLPRETQTIPAAAPFHPDRPLCLIVNASHAIDDSAFATGQSAKSQSEPTLFSLARFP